jgi:hypothetical protein
MRHISHWLIPSFSKSLSSSHYSSSISTSLPHTKGWLHNFQGPGQNKSKIPWSKLIKNFKTMTAGHEVKNREPVQPHWSHSLSSNQAFPVCEQFSGCPWSCPWLGIWSHLPLALFYLLAKRTSIPVPNTKPWPSWQDLQHSIYFSLVLWPQCYSVKQESKKESNASVYVPECNVILLDFLLYMHNFTWTITRTWSQGNSFVCPYKLLFPFSFITHVT